MNLRRLLLRKRTIGVAVAGIAVAWVGVIAFNSFTFNPERWVKLRARELALERMPVANKPVEKWVKLRAREHMANKPVEKWRTLSEYRSDNPHATEETIDYNWKWRKQSAVRDDNGQLIPWYLNERIYCPVSIEGPIGIRQNKSEPNTWYVYVNIYMTRRKDDWIRHVNGLAFLFELKPDGTLSEQLWLDSLGGKWSFTRINGGSFGPPFSHYH